MPPLGRLNLSPSPDPHRQALYHLSDAASVAQDRPGGRATSTTGGGAERQSWLAVFTSWTAITGHCTGRGCLLASIHWEDETQSCLLMLTLSCLLQRKKSRNSSGQAPKAAVREVYTYTFFYILQIHI